MQPGYGDQPGYPPAGQAGYPPPGQPGYPPAGAYPPAGQTGYPPAGQGGYPAGPPPHAGAPPSAPPPAGAALPPGGYQGGPPSGPAGWDPNSMEKGAPPPEGGVAGDGAEPNASAPPLDKMDTIQGYSGIGFGGTSAPPPSYNEVMQGQQPTREPPRDVPVINEEQAREALMQFVSEHCCYGKKPAELLNFRDLKSTSAFHYTLETFTECRSTAWAYEPYNGQPIDGPMNGAAPGPWDMPFTPKHKFKDHEEHREVPHTASVKPCHQCVGNGRVRCNHCYGRGRTNCHHCHGRGRETHYVNGEHRERRCTWCHGDGRQSCTWCHGSGQRQCPTCHGRCNLKCYIKLTVKWINHLEDHIVERTNLPDHLIRGVSGQTAFEEELPWVWPINHFPDPTINAASNQIVQKHRTAFPSERMLLQRHRVRIVPVTEVTTEYKDKGFTYFVYGFEHKVHAPDYPAKCCCGCTIL